MKQHTEDYKISAIKYYLKGKKTLKYTCKIFDCKHKSLSRWTKRYKIQGNIKRKQRVNKNLKITDNISKFVKDYTKKYPTTTLWNLSKLVKKKYKIKLSDSSIHNIFERNKITRKRLRNKYYPEDRLGKEQNALNEFYNKLNNYNY